MEEKGCVEEVRVFMTGPSGPLDVSRETELAVENFMLSKELARLETSNGKLQTQNQRCEAALKKMNHLIDEYVRRARQYDRKLKISQADVEDLSKKLDLVSNERRQMARTFGKHREARVRIQSKFDDMEEAFRLYKEEKTELDSDRRAEIARLTKLLTESRAQHDIDTKNAQTRDARNTETIASHEATIATRDASISVLKQEVATAQATMEDCLNNVQQTAPYLKLQAHATDLQSQLVSMTLRASKLKDQVEHLTAENIRVVSFAAAEGLEIPDLCAVPHQDDPMLAE